MYSRGASGRAHMHTYGCTHMHTYGCTYAHMDPSELPTCTSYLYFLPVAPMRGSADERGSARFWKASPGSIGLIGSAHREASTRRGAVNVCRECIALLLSRRRTSPACMHVHACACMCMCMPHATCHMPHATCLCPPGCHMPHTHATCHMPHAYAHPAATRTRRTPGP